MAIKSDFLLVLKSSGLGEGEPDLSEKLLDSFLETLLVRNILPARIICLNSAIFLTTNGSPTSKALRELDQKGAEVLSCTTCLEYYGRKDNLAIGEATNMREIVDSITGFDQVVSL